MANREENLKEINAELEMLSDDELEKVSGGYVCDVECDSQFLKDVGMMNKPVTIGIFGSGWRAETRAVEDGWSASGITCYTDYFGDNKYWIKSTGKEISREAAMSYVANKLGKNINIANYIPEPIEPDYH